MEEKNKISGNQKDERKSVDREDIEHYIKIKKRQNQVLGKIIKIINQSKESKGTENPTM